MKKCGDPRGSWSGPPARNAGFQAGARFFDPVCMGGDRAPAALKNTDCASARRIARSALWPQTWFQRLTVCFRECPARVSPLKSLRDLEVTGQSNPIPALFRTHESGTWVTHRLVLAPSTKIVVASSKEKRDRKSTRLNSSH